MRLRSLLFVPGDRPERFAKAAESGADAIILDLEDSVAPAAKDKARAVVADYLAAPLSGPVRRLVRINPVDGGTLAEDLAAGRLVELFPGALDADPLDITALYLTRTSGLRRLAVFLDWLGDTFGAA